jgi:hypothetical protein
MKVEVSYVADCPTHCKRPAHTRSQSERENLNRWMGSSIPWYPSSMSDMTIARRAIAHRGRRLEYFTIAWNTLEGLVGVGAGLLAGSISLVGFGVDSFIEVTSGATLLWRMSVDEDAERRERSERLSLRIVGVCFIALATYIAYEAIVDLASFCRETPIFSRKTRICKGNSST